MSASLHVIGATDPSAVIAAEMRQAADVIASGAEGRVIAAFLVLRVTDGPLDMPVVFGQPMSNVEMLGLLEATKFVVLTGAMETDE